MSDTRSLVTDAELDAAADALGWPANEQARAHALVALTAAARARREEHVTPEEEAHDEMCPGCPTCLHPNSPPVGVLARDVARMWASADYEFGHLFDTSDEATAAADLTAALDRLATAYLPDGPKDEPDER